MNWREQFFVLEIDDDPLLCGKIDIINCRFIWLSSSIVFHSGSEPPISGFMEGVLVVRPLGICCRENTDRDFKILIVKLKPGRARVDFDFTISILLHDQYFS